MRYEEKWALMLCCFNCFSYINEPLVPFSAIIPGMTLEEVKELEPSIEDETNGIEICTFITQESLKKGIG